MPTHPPPSPPPPSSLWDLGQQRRVTIDPCGDVGDLLPLLSTGRNWICGAPPVLVIHSLVSQSVPPGERAVGSAADGESSGGSGGRVPNSTPISNTQPNCSPPPPSSPPSATAALTRELLQLHDQRWEERCRDHWRRRLSQQTTMSTPTAPQQKRPLSQEQPGIFGGRPPSEWHQQPAVKLARCRSERSAWAAPQHEEIISSPVQSIQQEQQPFCSLPAELLALLGAVLQSVPEPAVQIKVGAAAPVNSLGLHPLLLDQLLQAAANARSTLSARLLKQDDNNGGNDNGASVS
uniref:Uncharacterized protein n=1 Tax=Globodera pallida TaxID=36090 RepID=A0A183BUK8_GLOPA